ncbi:MAG: glycosyltransferase family 2 protein [Rhodobacteraceae bacterium]|nr:glycosyltransferase family 2 protein [Paracoccaceae bacterium]
MSQTDPRVGIVIRTKDRPLFVTRALRTVLAQTLDDWQVVLVNDGGARALLEPALADDDLAAAFASGAMTALHLPEPVGRSVAFNRGVEALRAEFVCCLDDDDTWAPDFLASLVAFFDRIHALAPDLGGVASLVTAVREDIVTEDGVDTLVAQGEDELPNAFRRKDFFLDPVAYATYRHDLYPVQWMLRRTSVLEAGGFPPAFNVMEDRAFMTRFLQTWRVAILDRKLAFHHRRARRKGDTSQSVHLNTLDNPSYDWRLFSDLAKARLNTPPPGALTDGTVTPAGAELIRAAAATVIKELNDETSALWHKINGEAATLRARIAELDARIGGNTAPAEIDTPVEDRVWSLWPSIGELDVAFRLGVGTPFLERFDLSMPEDQPGLLMHASPVQRRLVIQVPRTSDWAAVELSLAGLVRRGEGLRCEMVVSHPQGYLFETALSAWHRDLIGRRSHSFEGNYVHSCPPGGSLLVRRDFPADWLARADQPRLSVALPRQAQDFRFICHDLVVSRI